jgi:hypothetical protein
MQIFPDGQRCLYRYNESNEPSPDAHLAAVSLDDLASLKALKSEAWGDSKPKSPLFMLNPDTLNRLQNKAPFVFNLTSSSSSPAATHHKRESFAALWSVKRCVRFSVTYDDSDSFISFRMPVPLKQKYQERCLTQNDSPQGAASSSVSRSRSVNSATVSVQVVPIIRIEYSDDEHPLPVTIPADLFPHVRVSNVIVQLRGRLTIYGLFDEVTVTLDQEPTQVCDWFIIIFYSSSSFLLYLL